VAEPRRHHLVPQFYMRSFANAKEQVRVIERSTGNEFTAKTANVFVERDYYTTSSVYADDDHGLIEGLYFKVEGVAAPIFEQLRDGEFPLGGQDRAEFASFMALQESRGRMFRRSMNDLIDQMGHTMLRTVADAPARYWEAKRAEWKANRRGTEPTPPLTDRERQMLREGTAFDIKPSREYVVEMSFAHHEEMAFLLMAMTWRLIVFPAPCLFSSENPISYSREPSPMDRMFGIGTATADEVRIPISPTRALVLTPPEPGRKPFDISEHERAYAGDQAAAERFNWGTLSFPPSERLLLSPDTAQHPLPRHALESFRPATQVINTERRPGVE
jgi:hypothetical protein